jgi:hypothetical protein
MSRRRACPPAIPEPVETADINGDDRETVVLA